MSASSGGTVVRHRYVHNGARMQAKLWDALRYLECRPLGEHERPSERQLFTAHADGLARQDARTLLLEHAGHRVAYHRLILSPGVPVEDLQRWTRLVLADLARHLGQDLHWVAAVHRNTAHPHVHVLLAGSGEHLPGGGRALPVALGLEDYALLRASGNRHGRDVLRADQDLAEAVRVELDFLLGGLVRAIAKEAGDAGVQHYQHLAEHHERRGAPGRDATQGR